MVFKLAVKLLPILCQELQGSHVLKINIVKSQWKIIYYHFGCPIIFFINQVFIGPERPMVRHRYGKNTFTFLQPKTCMCVNKKSSDGSITMLDTLRPLILEVLRYWRYSILAGSEFNTNIWKKRKFSIKTRSSINKWSSQCTQLWSFCTKQWTIMPKLYRFPRREFCLRRLRSSEKMESHFWRRWTNLLQSAVYT